MIAATEIASALEERGWDVKVRRKEEVEDLVEVDRKGIFKCVDGRLSDKKDMMRGPKVLGGIYGLVAMRGQGDLDSLRAVVGEVRDAGYVPSVHSDDHNGAMGCGFFKLWSNGQLVGLESPGYTADEGRIVAEQAGAVHETLEGAHDEKVVVINLVSGTTLEPNEKRFIVDAWVVGGFDLDVGAYLNRGAETVEKLNGPKKAVIISNLLN